jgi:hypothetical protein
MAGWESAYRESDYRCISFVLNRFDPEKPCTQNHRQNQAENCCPLATCVL